MKKIIFFGILIAIFSFLIINWLSFSSQEKITGAPPYEVSDEDPQDINDPSWLSNWVRPEGPPKIALQVGHWKTDEVPDELHRLAGNSGASGGGMAEWEVNMAIAKETAKLLEGRGIVVEILPTTVPSRYWADAFIAIHADGSTDPYKTGFKAATPRRDMTGKAEDLLNHIETSYQNATGLEKDPNVTRNMRGYYAFSWWRYDHAVHPMTPSLILETGFLTTAADREIIVDNPQQSAQGIAEGIIAYLESQNLLNS